MEQNKDIGLSQKWLLYHQGFSTPYLDQKFLKCREQAFSVPPAPAPLGLYRKAAHAVSINTQHPEPSSH